MNFRYEKWEATGNDFVVVDLNSVSPNTEDFTPELVRQVCDRKAGVGADGVVLLDFSCLPVRMVIINSDGSPSGMCGNALRCVAQILKKRTGKVEGSVVLGDRTIETSVDSDGLASVVLGPPQGVPGHEPYASSSALDNLLGRGYLLWFGNPHNVVPVERLPVDWVDQGKEAQDIAAEQLGTGGINCGFLQTSPTDGIYPLRVYERGAGVTQSCGSGACAASAVLERALQVPPPHRLELLGGVLTVGRAPGGFTLAGAARQEFEGEWL